VSWRSCFSPWPQRRPAGAAHVKDSSNLSGLGESRASLSFATNTERPSAWRFAHKQVVEPLIWAQPEVPLTLSRTPLLGVALPLGLAALFGAYHLGAKSLWWDEAFSVWLARLDWPVLWRSIPERAWIPTLCARAKQGGSSHQSAHHLPPSLIRATGSRPTLAKTCTRMCTDWARQTPI